MQDKHRIAEKKLQKAVLNEALVLESLKGCPNICQLHDTFEDKANVYFVLELCRYAKCKAAPPPLPPPSFPSLWPLFCPCLPHLLPSPLSLSSSRSFDPFEDKAIMYLRLSCAGARA